MLPGGALASTGVLLLLSMAANRAGVRATWAYAILGLVLWSAVLQSGVHATVAGALLAFTIPARTLVNQRQFLDESRRALHEFDCALPDQPLDLAEQVLTNERSREALHRLEHALHGFVAFGIMPLFALANAGVRLEGDVVDLTANPVTLGIVFGLVPGKPLGITLFAWLATRVGVAAVPAGASWAAVHGVGWLACRVCSLPTVHAAATAGRLRAGRAKDESNGLISVRSVVQLYPGPADRTPCPPVIW